MALAPLFISPSSIRLKGRWGLRRWRRKIFGNQLSRSLCVLSTPSFYPSVYFQQVKWILPLSCSGYSRASPARQKPGRRRRSSSSPHSSQSLCDSSGWMVGWLVGVCIISWIINDRQVPGNHQVVPSLCPFNLNNDLLNFTTTFYCRAAATGSQACTFPLSVSRNQCPFPCLVLHLPLNSHYLAPHPYDTLSNRGRFNSN